MTRPSRRRRLLRWLVWTALVLLVAVAALVLTLNSSPVERRLIAFAEGRASEALERPLTIGGLEVGLLPLTVEARDVVLAGPTPSATPVARIPRARVTGRLLRLRRPILELARIEVFAPEIYLESADGGTNLPTFGGDGEGGGVEVRIGSLMVEEGTLRFAETELPLELSADGLWLRAEGQGTTDLRFHARADRFVSRLPEAEPWPASLRLRGLVTATGLEIDEVALHGEDLRLAAQGEVAWGGDVAWQTALDLSLAGDAAWARRVGYVADEIAGAWSAEVVVTADPAGWQVSGEARSRRLAVAGLTFEDVTSGLEGAAAGWRFAPLRFAHAGGRLSGSALLDLGERPELAVEATYGDLSIRRLLAPFAVEAPATAGRVSGELTYRAPLDDVLTGNGATDLRWRGVPPRALGPLPPPPAREERPADGRARIVLAAGGLEVEALTADYLGTELRGRGRYGLTSGEGSGEVVLRSADFAALQVLLPPAPVAWDGGRGTVTARFALDAQGLSGDARLDLADLRLADQSLTRLAGDLRTVAPELFDVDLVATAGDGELALRGRVPLAGEGLDLSGRFEAWSLVGLDALVAGLPEIGGRLDAAFEASGSLAAPRIEARGEVPALEVAGQPLGASRFELAGSAERWNLEAFEISPPAGAVTGSGTWFADGTLEGAVEGPALSLGGWPFDLLHDGNLAGEVAVTARLAGTTAAPEAEVEITSRGATLGSESLAPAALRGRWQGGQVTVEGSLFGLAEITGGGPASGEALDLRFAIASENLRDGLRLATGTDIVGLRGDLAGEVTVNGPASAPVANLALDRFRVGYQDREVRAVEPVRLAWRDGALVLESLFVEEQQGIGELFMAGRVDLAEDRLALNVQSSLNAAWLRLAMPDLKADGTLSLLATVRGALSAPVINGLGELQQGRLVMAGFPHSFEAVDLRLLFDPGVMIVDRLDADFAGGRARAAGRLDLTAALAGRLEYRLQARVEDATLRYPEGFVVRGDATLVATPTAVGGTQIAGSVDLDRAFYLEDVPVSLPQLLRGMLQRDRLEVTEADAVLGSVELAIAIRGPEALRVRNNVADLRGDIDLSLRGTAAVPVITGLVDLTPGGTLVQGEVEYEVERGRVTFNSRYEIDPVIDLIAETEVAGHDVRLALSGTLDKLTTELTSEPALSQVEILSLLATGRPSDGVPFGGGGGDGSSSDGVETFLYGQAANLLGERVNRLFGFDRFRVNPVASAEGGSSLSFTVGKQISRDLYITYTSDPSTDLDYRVQVEWQVSDTLTVVLSQDGDDTYAVDLRLEHRF